jgi:hypothetical protein
MIFFLFGLFVGGFIGVLLTALAIAMDEDRDPKPTGVFWCTRCLRDIATGAKP